MNHRTRVTAKEIAEDLSHCVDIAVPPRGLGWRLAAMYDFMPAIEYRRSVGMASVVLFAGALRIAPWLMRLHRNSQETRKRVLRRGPLDGMDCPREFS
jgi:hypothetical protein